MFYSRPLKIVTTALPKPKALMQPKKASTVCQFRLTLATPHIAYTEQKFSNSLLFDMFSLRAWEEFFECGARFGRMCN